MEEAKLKIGDQWFCRGNRSNTWFATLHEDGGLAERVPPICWPFLEEIARLTASVCWPCKGAFIETSPESPSLPRCSACKLSLEQHK